jgi:hypothetical protein
VAGGINNFGEYTAGGAYTLFGSGSIANTLNYAEAEDDLDAGSAGSKAVDFTGFGTNWSMTVASFKIAGGGAANWGRLLGNETNRLVRVVG